MDTPDSTTLKQCAKCGELKPVDAFCNDAKGKDGKRAQCKSCRREYRKANAEHTREYRRANIDRQREWRKANAERIRDYMHEYYAANIEHLKEYKRKYTREYVKRDYVRAASKAKWHRYRASKVGNGGNYTTDDLAKIRAAQTDRRGRLICWKCGKPIKDTPHLDHWQPLKHGGRNDAGNLHYMHAKCNLSKGAKHPNEIGRLL